MNGEAAHHKLKNNYKHWWSIVYTSNKRRLDNLKNIVFSHVNINSLKKETNAPLDYFKYILNKHFIDILCISEAKLNNGIVNRDINCSRHFKVNRKDRSLISGGWCTWIQSDIPQQRLYHL